MRSLLAWWLKVAVGQDHAIPAKGGLQTRALAARTSSTNGNVTQLRRVFSDSNTRDRFRNACDRVSKGIIRAVLSLVSR
jgi:hypothetical protein